MREIIAQKQGAYLLTESRTAIVSSNQSIFPISTAINEDDTLTIGGCEVVKLVEQFATPLYILDEHHIRQACREFIAAVSNFPIQTKILYASKALSTLAIAAIIHSEGLGIDVMSQGELFAALNAKISPQDIYFHGNNKSEAEINAALKQRCKIVVDNWQELFMIARLSQQQALDQVKILIRITPNIESFTHQYIRTGQFDSKFGFNYDEVHAVVNKILQNNNLELLGLHMHIGSQISNLNSFKELAQVAITTLNDINQTYHLKLGELNLGGGLAVNYASEEIPSIKQWCATIIQEVVNFCQQQNIKPPKILLEPGRSIVATAGVTAYTAGSQKIIKNGVKYIAIDGGMSDNPRPITYSAEHMVVVANRVTAEPLESVTIVGKHCESGDVLFKDVRLPKVQAGDVIVAAGTGAYNYSQSSNYNRLPRPAMVLVGDGMASLIVERETNEDLFRNDRVPQHLRFVPQS